MLKIVGDINFTDGFFDTGLGVGSSIRQGKDPFIYLNRNEYDFWIGNCECLISNESNKKGIYKKQFIISPEHIAHIKHFDLYNVSNNHVMQHGAEAYNNMLKYFQDKAIFYVGSLERKSIKFFHQEKTIGIIAFSQRKEKYSDAPLYWYDPEYIEIAREFTNISEADFKIAYIHWGNEFIDRPYVDQKRFAHWLVDIGFDLIIGLHPHVLQGYELYNDKYIFYSIGNFVFNMPFVPTKYSIIVSIDLAQEKPSIDFDYIHIGNDYFPSLIKETLVPDHFRLDYLNKRLKIEQENESYYKEVAKSTKAYRKANYISVIKSIRKFHFKDLSDILIDFIRRKFIVL